MAFADLTSQGDALALLQRSLDRGRLGHAYLFSGESAEDLAAAARTLAKTMNCERPPARGASGLALDCCDACPSCRSIDAESHPDVPWVRPESKSRVITVDQTRELMHTVQLKPAQAVWKVALIESADRMNVQAANAFLKTLEEPPPRSLLLLLSTEPSRLLETILSRCLRLSLSGERPRHRDPALLEWLGGFCAVAAREEKGLLGRYRLLGALLERLAALKEVSAKSLSARSPLERFDDLEPALKEKWEEELEAAIEADYRRLRADVIAGLQWFFRDVWLATLKVDGQLQSFPELAEPTRAIARRLSPERAMGNLGVLERLQRLLQSNVQEALALEVGLLQLRL
jgi:DNA polymerase-3 subunit delta'